MRACSENRKADKALSGYNFRMNNVLNALFAGVIAAVVASPAAMAGPDVLRLPFATDGTFQPFGCLGYNETWKAGAPIPLYRQPDGSSQVLTTLPKGATFRTLKGRILVLKPVDVVVSRPMALYNWGEKEGPSLRVEPGQHVYVLHDQGEESPRIWHNGKILRSVCLEVAPDGQVSYAEWDPDPMLNQIPKPLGKIAPGSPKRPVYQWWVFVRGSKDTEGWIEVKDDGRIQDLWSCYD
jgi:hypothetical protein